MRCRNAVDGQTCARSLSSCAIFLATPHSTVHLTSCLFLSRGEARRARNVESTRRGVVGSRARKLEVESRVGCGPSTCSTKDRGTCGSADLTQVVGPQQASGVQERLGFRTSVSKPWSREARVDAEGVWIIVDVVDVAV